MKSRNCPALATALQAATRLVEALKRLEDAAADQQPPGELCDMLESGDLAGWRWSASLLVAGLESYTVPDRQLWRRLDRKSLQTV